VISRETILTCQYQDPSDIFRLECRFFPLPPFKAKNNLFLRRPFFLRQPLSLRLEFYPSSGNPLPCPTCRLFTSRPVLSFLYTFLFRFFLLRLNLAIALLLPVSGKAFIFFPAGTGIPAATFPPGRTETPYASRYFFGDFPFYNLPLDLTIMWSPSPPRIAMDTVLSSPMSRFLSFYVNLFFFLRHSILSFADGVSSSSQGPPFFLFAFTRGAFFPLLLNCFSPPLPAFAAAITWARCS